MTTCARFSEGYGREGLDTIDFEIETQGESNRAERLDRFARQDRATIDDLLCQEKEPVMPKRKIQLLDTVALLEDLPKHKLKCGEVGTVVEVLVPDAYEVEFCDDEGQTYAELVLRSEQIIVLHNQGESLKIVA